MIVIERPREVGQPRRKVWCNKTDLMPQGEGYVFNDLAQDALGFGSIVFVVDEPGLVLWYDNESGEMYERVLGSGGGPSVAVEPLSVTENGRYAEEGKAYNPVVVEVPQVSGNPNYVETITGTVANPWGEYAFADLLTAHRNHDLSMYLTSDDLPYTITPVGRAAMKRRFVCVNTATASVVTLAAIDYTSTGGFSAGRVYTYVGGTMQITDIDPTQACTLTIIHHPMTGSMQMAESATFGGNA